MCMWITWKIVEPYGRIEVTPVYGRKEQTKIKGYTMEKVIPCEECGKCERWKQWKK